MAIDFKAFISNGTYPTPTPTSTQRAVYFISWGMLGVAPDGEAPASGVIDTILKIGRKGIKLAGGLLRIGRR